jgi:hypothetical protein
MEQPRGHDCFGYTACRDDMTTPVKRFRWLPTRQTEETLNLLSPVAALIRFTFVGALLLPALSEAQWVKVDSAEPATIYVDPNSAQREGNLVKLWELVDYHQAQAFAGQTFRSTRVLREFDCRKREMRTLAFTIFADPMARGSVVHSHRVQEPTWELVEPYSIGQSSFEVACANG